VRWLTLMTCLSSLLGCAPTGGAGGGGPLFDSGAGTDGGPPVAAGTMTIAEATVLHLGGDALV